MARADRFFNGIPYWLEATRAMKEDAKNVADKMRVLGFKMRVEIGRAHA